MATTQKKAAAPARRTGTASGGKRASSSAPKNSGGAKKSSAPSRGGSQARSGGSRGRPKTSSRSAPARTRPVRREVGALVCLLLGIFAAFGYWDVKALFIDFYVGLLKGLTGYGFWLAPPAFLLAAYILAFHRGRPIRTRVTCALVLPVLLSGLVHGLMSEVLPWNGGLLGTLWTSGQSLKSGGLLGGLLGQILVALLSDLGCTIVLGMASVFVGLAAFNRTIFDVADWVFSQPHPAYEPRPPKERPRPAPRPVTKEPYQPTRLKEPPRPAPRSAPARGRRKKSIDIPGPQTPEERKGVSGENEAERQERRGLLDTLTRGASGLLRMAQGGSSAEEIDEEEAEDGSEQFVRSPIQADGPVPVPDDRRIWDYSHPAPLVTSGRSRHEEHPGSVGEDPELPPDTDLLTAAGEEDAYEAPIPAAEEHRRGPREEAPLFLMEEPPRTPPARTAPARPVRESAPVPATASAGGNRAAAAAVPEPALDKVSKKDAARAAVEVAQDIQSSMQQSSVPYQYPPVSLLHAGGGDIGTQAMAELNSNRQRLSDTIHSFGIDARIVNVTRGPSVTRYELELDQGVRLNKLTNLSDDIALSLGASGVRIAPIPDQISMVGIEVPNKTVSPVHIHSVISSHQFADNPSRVAFAVGKDIGGIPVVGNIAKMPHMLIAGTTGSGKSVCTNSLIISLLYKATPDEVRLIMVDPKMVELGIYNGIPHLLIPVVTDPKKAAGALQWAVNEMMKRYKTFSEVGVRDLASYNELARRTEGLETMPQIVVIIDELADLMLVAAKEVEESICRVAQMGRASGMHLVIATQRPSADVITGLMKANIPSRIAFAVASGMESRIILDQTGAEKLVGRGDMLYFPLGSGKPTRVQGCLITDQEVADVVDFVKKNSGTAQYDESVMVEIDQNTKQEPSSQPEELADEYDELLLAAGDVIVEMGQGSVSMLQRRLKLGYARAARLMDQLEECGIVGPPEGSKPRQLLITKEEWQEFKYRRGGGFARQSAPPPEPAPEPVPAPEDDADGEDEDDGLDRSEEDTL